MSPALLRKEKQSRVLVSDLEIPRLAPSTLACTLSSVNKSLEGIISLNSEVIQPSLTQSFCLSLLIHSSYECLHMVGTDVHVSELWINGEFLVLCLLAF